MSPSSQIQFLQHHQIDKKKYDNCIASSINSLIYARSFYLDNMSAGWNVLAGENYDWVMPLTWRKKLGIKYLYQPAFTQQLGIFYKEDVSVPHKEISNFLKTQYRFFEINFNYDNHAATDDGKIKTTSCTNFVLPLDHDYQKLYNNYKKDALKNLRRSERFELLYRPSKDHNISIDLYIEHYGQRTTHVTVADHNKFRKVCAYAYEAEMLYCRDVVNQSNELLSTILLFKDGRRLYNLMNTTTKEGRKVEANYLLLNSVIKEFSGQSLVFDFEGSDIPGVKQFYENFGAKNQPYIMAKYNNLPWPMRLLK